MRARILRYYVGLLVRLAVALVTSVASAWAFAPPSWFSGSVTVDVPFEASGLVPGPDGTALILGAGGELALFDIATASIVGMAELEGQPVAVAAGSRMRTEARIAVVTRAADGSLSLTGLSLGARGPIGTIALKLDERFADAVAPGAIVIGSDEDRAAGGRRLLLWDRAPVSPIQYFSLLKPGGYVAVPVKDIPRALAPIGAGKLMLGIHPESDLLSIVDPAQGDLIDLVSVDGLAYTAPESLALFAPMAPEGGSGSVVIANAESGILTIVTVGGVSRPRLDLPLQLTLPDPFRAAGARPAVAADHDAQFILTGIEGAAELRVVQRLKGALSFGDTLVLDAPLRALTAVSPPSGSGEDAFLFITGDGRSLTVSDIASLLQRARNGVTFQPQVAAAPNVPLEAGSLNGLATIEVMRLQRALGGLGYKIGAVDGMGGPLTETALRAFQLDQGLEPTGKLDPETAKALQAALSASGGQTANGRVLDAFDRTIDTALGEDFDSGRLLAMGPTQTNVDHPCFGMNDVPPEALWPNAVKFANLLRRIEGELGQAVEVVAGYQNEALTRCLGVGAHPLHGAFQAFDIRLAGAGDGGVKDLSRLLDGLEARGLASVELQADGALLHVGIEIGRNLAVVASYPAGPRTCEAAKADVDEFARLLAGGDLAGREIFVARLADRDIYAVVVDANSDQRAADAASREIAAVAPQSSDRKTGADSYVIRNRDLFFDPACTRVAVIRDQAQRKKY
ncbi:peptidoglycan-binding domain-containing protein [Frigidibacter sp. RF13]|uniref:peptidoglycan-binding domain-containing protein n=1 Tax=Frigidibacter sp. RF13 TaxID=2997340 RepID=UPI002270644C|nr:peptidoglycan-binding domain-containing protein [Frigidibacter sp. RF13]MCY1125534.1 peptidoglycan-binding domain-containing protein [Frigidibacter sp. RF13]